MSPEREYEIVLQPEPEGGFSVFVLELPRVATQGETIEGATEMAKEAIEAYLEVMHEDGLPIPTVHRTSVAVFQTSLNRTVPEEMDRVSGSRFLKEGNDRDHRQV
jgi:antitoxin HicB